jgi:hypothetical protein
MKIQKIALWYIKGYRQKRKKEINWKLISLIHNSLAHCYDTLIYTTTIVRWTKQKFKRNNHLLWNVSGASLASSWIIINEFLCDGAPMDPHKKKNYLSLFAPARAYLYLLLHCCACFYFTSNQINDRRRKYFKKFIYCNRFFEIE